MAIIGVGTAILVTGGAWTAQPYPYHPVKEAYSFGPVSDDREEIEITNYQSFKAGTTQGYREYTPGLRTDAELEFEANYVGVEYLAWHAAKEQSVKLGFNIVYPDYFYHSFAGTIKGVDLSIPVDDRMTYTVSSTITAALTFNTNTIPLYSGVANILSAGNTADIIFYDSPGATANDAPVNSARQIEYLLANPATSTLEIWISIWDGATLHPKKVLGINPTTGIVTVEGTWGFTIPATYYTLNWFSI